MMMLMIIRTHSNNSSSCCESPAHQFSFDVSAVVLITSLRADICWLATEGASVPSAKVASPALLIPPPPRPLAPARSAHPQPLLPPQIFTCGITTCTACEWEEHPKQLRWATLCCWRCACNSWQDALPKLPPPCHPQLPSHHPTSQQGPPWLRNPVPVPLEARHGRLPVRRD